ncbi:very-long-chain 3-oxoacyl-CoA reductase-A [Silurus meridionalis]|nr:very-long-chain 3-oxoacyl-CoA reductase-A [Silurus meridionalis]
MWLIYRSAAYSDIFTKSDSQPLCFMEIKMPSLSRAGISQIVNMTTTKARPNSCLTALLSHFTLSVFATTQSSRMEIPTIKGKPDLQLFGFDSISDMKSCAEPNPVVVYLQKPKSGDISRQHARPVIYMEHFDVEKMRQLAETPLLWVGAVTTASLALWLLFHIISGFKIWVLGNGDLLSPKLGKWAVVTGATDGIGKSYAEELARRGFSILLISRSQEKLDDVAKSLESLYKVETKTIAVDFGQINIYPKIEDALAGLEIGVLVNNVGISYPYPEFFLHIPDLDKFINTMINVNITSVCQMTRLVLPKMEARAKGVILNISSASGMYPVPLLTVYSSTKASSVLPFFVATKMTRIRKPTLDKPTPERYVAAELTTVGLQDQTNGYFPHAVMGWLTTVLVPIKLVIYFGMRMNKAQRGGYLRRRKLR